MLCACSSTTQQGIPNSLMKGESGETDLHALQGTSAQWFTLVPYSPKNKPPPLFDLQVLAQVFLPCFISPCPYAAKCALSAKINAWQSTTMLLLIV